VAIHLRGLGIQMTAWLVWGWLWLVWGWLWLAAQLCEACCKIFSIQPV